MYPRTPESVIFANLFMSLFSEATREMCYEASQVGLSIDGYTQGTSGLQFFLNSYNTDFEEFVADYFSILKNYEPNP